MLNQLFEIDFNSVINKRKFTYSALSLPLFYFSIIF